MGRKTGANASIEVELGNTFYPMAELTSVSSPTADVDKKFLTSAIYMSDLEALQPEVRLDGVLSGCSITPGSADSSVDVSAGEYYIAGVKYSLTANTVTALARPATSGQVIVTSLTVDNAGAVTKTPAAEGVATATRGSNGGPPFLPVGEVLIGYVTITTVAAAVVTVSEIDSQSKERAAIPSAKINYHDGLGSNPQNVGIIEMANVLSKIHAATAAGPGTACRKVFAAYSAALFEEIPDTKDFKFDEDISTYKSKAYRDDAEETAMGTPSWSGGFSAYFKTVEDILGLIKNSKRWIKHYPDASLTAHWVGRAVIKVGRETPVENTLSASVSLEGSGALFPKS